MKYQDMSMEIIYNLSGQIKIDDTCPISMLYLPNQIWG